jgi:hypothetical protein
LKSRLVAKRGVFVTAGNSPLGSEWTFREVCSGNSLKSLDAGINSATANQVRLALHTAAFWLKHCVRSAIPQTNPLARCEFATLRERLIKIGARVIEHIARIRVRRSKRSSPDFLRALAALETIHRLITRLTVLPWVSIAAMARGCPSENY